MPPGQEDKLRVPVDLKALKARSGKHGFGEPSMYKLDLDFKSAVFTLRTEAAIH